MVKIIHGKNNGILRNTVHEYLKDNSNIQSYRIGNYYEGGIGVTIAFMK
jgi:DNA mismatch repair protein MutS2